MSQIVYSRLKNEVIILTISKTSVKSLDHYYVGHTPTIYVYK